MRSSQHNLKYDFLSHRFGRRCILLRKMTSFRPDYLDLVLHLLDSPKANKEWRKNVQTLVHSDKGYAFFQVSSDSFIFQYRN